MRGNFENEYQIARFAAVKRRFAVSSLFHITARISPCGNVDTNGGLFSLVAFAAAGRTLIRYDSARAAASIAHPVGNSTENAVARSVLNRTFAVTLIARFIRRTAFRARRTAVRARFFPRISNFIFTALCRVEEGKLDLRPIYPAVRFFRRP